MSRNVARWVLTLFMVTLGVLHFTATEQFAQIVPPWLPSPVVLVWISGVCEIGLGLALQWPPARRVAGWGLVALYVAVFPANVYMATHNVQIQGLPETPRLMLWLRLPFQLMFIAWALWVTQPRRDARGISLETSGPK